MSITFNQAIMNEHGMTYSQTLEVGEQSVMTTVTRVSFPAAPYHIVYTDIFNKHDDVDECYFLVFPYTTPFLTRFFEEAPELFALSDDDFFHLEGCTLHFGVKYIDQ